MKKKNKMFNAISKIKQIFEDIEGTESDYVEVKTIDGKILRANILAIDQEVVEITEDGEVALEDNDYVIEGGDTLVVEGGVIIEIIKGEEEEGEVVEDEVVEDEFKKAVIKMEDGTEIEIDADKLTKVLELIEEVEDVVADEEVEADDTEAIVEDIVEEIKELVEEFKSIKKEFASVKAENRQLKRDVAKFSKSASEGHTDTKVKFSVATSNKPKSMLHTLKGK